MLQDWITFNQCGFKSSRSTFMALIELVEEINCIDGKKYAMGIFVDLKTSIWHNWSWDNTLKKNIWGMASEGLHLIGLRATLKTGLSLWRWVITSQRVWILPVVSHRGQSWARSYLFCTWMIFVEFQMYLSMVFLRMTQIFINY